MILTSHYMADVAALCARVILIHHGQVLYDGHLAGLAQQLAPFKLIRLSLDNGYAGKEANLPSGAEVIGREDGRLVVRVGRAEAPALTAHLLHTLPVADLAVEDPPLEAVIDQVYREGEL
jgi:ABC-2 type transport system ATP-binding protein